MGREKNVLAICAGVGGLELGLQLAHQYRGETVRGVCYVEREAAAAASLVASMDAGWFHPAPIWSDAATFDGAKWRGCVDIVTSGDPCQGNSVAGKRRGELDDRWLLDRAIDIYDQSGASTFFRENVTGNCDGQLAVAIPALERLGCRIAVGIFSSAETGNSMRRERLFILARRDVGRPDSMHDKGIGGEGRAEGWEDQERQIGLSGRAILQTAVIPGPDNYAEWGRLLDHAPHLKPATDKAEAESLLRGGFDAVAHRIERLRASGNGVDPMAAAYAFLSLDALLAGSASARGNVLMRKAT